MPWNNKLSHGDCKNDMRETRRSGIVPDLKEQSEPVTLKQCNKDKEFLLCPLDNEPIDFPEDVGITFFKDKWVILYGDGLFLDKNDVDPAQRVVKAGNTTLVFEGKPSFLDIMDIIYSRILLLIQEKGHDKVLPLLPVKHEYLDYIEHETADSISKNDCIHFTFKVLGGKKTKLVVPNLEEIKDINLEVWPNINYPEWKSFWISAEGKNIESYSLNLIVEKNLSIFEKQELSGNYNKIEGRPRFLSFQKKESSHVGGTFKLLEKASTSISKKDPVNIYIDFGTSRTTLGIDGSGNNELGDFINDTKTICKNYTNPEHAWSMMPPIKFISTSHQDAKLYKYICPSLVMSHSSNYSNLIPFKDFSIPCINKLNLLAPEYAPHAPRLIKDLKWPTNEQGKEWRKNYIIAVSIISVAQALMVNPSTTYIIKYSYPLALLDEVERFSNDMHNVVQRETNSLTGLNIIVEEKGLSESYVGKASASAEGEWNLTVDLGGGTLDIGLWSDDLILADSLYFGANNILEAYCKKTGRDEITNMYNVFCKGYKNLPEKERLEETVWKYLYLIQEYISRAIGGALIKQKLTQKSLPSTIAIVFLGSGWKVCEVIEGYDLDRIAQILAENIENRVHDLIPSNLSFSPPNIIYNTNVFKNGEEKLAIIKGLKDAREEETKTKEGIFAPNGLNEDHHNWYEFVGIDSNPFPKPKLFSSFDPDIPPFPGTIKRFSFDEILKDVNLHQQIITKMRKEVTDTMLKRKATALSIIYKHFCINKVKE